MILTLDDLSCFLQEKYNSYSSLEEFNQYLYSVIGVRNFFNSKKEFNEFMDFSIKYPFDSFSTDNREWGDIQTPKLTTDKIIKLIKDLKISPDIIIEPTYGTGNFIISSLEQFQNIKKIYGIEIHKEYEWSFKSKLLTRFLHSKKLIPEIKLFRESIFDHDFDINIFKNSKHILIIGNPPWVTNTELSHLKSSNIPKKNNFKKFKGIDAITGKSNFDLAESIILHLLATFSNFHGEMIMLCKNIVIKNLVKELPNYGFKISDIRSISIDAQEIFEKSVDASLLIIKLGKKSSNFTCSEITFEQPNSIKRVFGWIDGYFVSNTLDYLKFRDVEGICCFSWRSGIKHDCVGSLELTQDKKIIHNKFTNIVNVESDTLYPLLKGSMLKNFIISKSNKKLIVTQKRIAEDTNKLKDYPKLWKYLNDNLEFFKKRKSIIYKEKDNFSIFGVGDYSFKPYKVAIAGMYKEPRFSLCIPIDKKPVVFDDTCYFLSFDIFLDALFTNTLLNSDISINFLKSISFVDSKRPYTKENLSRINIYNISKKITFNQIKNIWKTHNYTNPEKITEKEYIQFINRISKLKNTK